MKDAEQSSAQQHQQGAPPPLRTGQLDQLDAQANEGTEGERFPGAQPATEASGASDRGSRDIRKGPVSYTHLTLPTKVSV